MSTVPAFNESVFGMGQLARAYIDGGFIPFDEGDAAPYVALLVDGGDETAQIDLDAYHLRELRLAITRAEKWLKANEPEART